MNQPDHDELTPDPRLRAALASLDEPHSEPVEWDRLRAAVAERAEMPLARRRRQHRSGRWLRTALPAAAAAGFALLLATQVVPSRSGAPEGDVPTAFHPAVEAVLGDEISEWELDLLFGHADADLLAVAAVERP